MDGIMQMYEELQIKQLDFLAECCEHNNVIVYEEDFQTALTKFTDTTVIWSDVRTVILVDGRGQSMISVNLHIDNVDILSVEKHPDNKVVVLFKVTDTVTRNYLNLEVSFNE
jgi:hypothetical protein